MVKLNKSRIKWLIRQVVKNGKLPSEVCSVYNLSKRRVQQLVKQYKDTGQMPELTKTRRPKTKLSSEQKKIIDDFFHRSKLSARLLYYEIKAAGYNIPKNKLYAHLKEKNWVVPNPKKQKQRKRCRYERLHSGSLIHGDGHRTSIDHPYCILWMDDASRKVLGGLESSTAITNELSIKSFKIAIKNAEKYNVIIHQANTDRGTEFFANKSKEGKPSKSKFQIFLEENGIQHVLSRIKNPQTNGKLERHWQEYNKHRWSFDTLKEYIDWYNNRLHGALKLEWAETPKQAFIRKQRPEAMIGLFFRRMG